MSDPTTKEAIEEVASWAWTVEGFEKSSRDLGQHLAATDWMKRGMALRRAEKILKAIEPYEGEVRKLLVDLKASEKRRAS
jgi:hypothetical protein